MWTRTRMSHTWKRLGRTCSSSTNCSSSSFLPSIFAKMWSLSTSHTTLSAASWSFLIARTLVNVTTWRPSCTASMANLWLWGCTSSSRLWTCSSRWSTSITLRHITGWQSCWRSYHRSRRAWQHPWSKSMLSSSNVYLSLCTRWKRWRPTIRSYSYASRTTLRSRRLYMYRWSKACSNSGP